MSDPSFGWTGDVEEADEDDEEAEATEPAEADESDSEESVSDTTGEEPEAADEASSDSSADESDSTDDADEEWAGNEEIVAEGESVEHGALSEAGAQRYCEPCDMWIGIANWSAHEDPEEGDHEYADPEENPHISDDYKEKVEAATDGGDEDPFADLAGNSMDLGEASEQEERRRIMVWGPPATGKTHTAFTARKPLALIDTERKSQDLASKFDVDPSRVRIWPVSNWDELETAVDEALEWLSAWHDERGERGTLAVDSMSDAWEWAKVDYIHRYYIEPDPTDKYEDPSDVDLKSGLQSNDPDWPKIKQQHNDLRGRMVDSPFDLVWTAMAKEDYNAKIEESLSTTPYTWHGETNNDHKVNYIVRHREGDDGQPIADLQKPGTTQHSFLGLEWPTLPKVFDVVDTIKEAENGPDTVYPSDIEDEHDVSLVKGKPTVAGGEDDG